VAVAAKLEEAWAEAEGNLEVEVEAKTEESIQEMHRVHGVGVVAVSVAMVGVVEQGMAEEEEVAVAMEVASAAAMGGVVEEETKGCGMRRAALYARPGGDRSSSCAW